MHVILMSLVGYTTPACGGPVDPALEIGSSLLLELEMLPRVIQTISYIRLIPSEGTNAVSPIRISCKSHCHGTGPSFVCFFLHKGMHFGGWVELWVWLHFVTS